MWRANAEAPPFQEPSAFLGPNPKNHPSLRLPQRLSPAHLESPGAQQHLNLVLTTGSQSD